MKHKDLFFVLNPVFFLPLQLPPRIINRGQDLALQKEDRPPFFLRGNSKQFYPKEEDVDEFVSRLYSPKKKKKSEKPSRVLG